MQITTTFEFLPNTPMFPGCDSLEESFKEALSLTSQGDEQGRKWIEEWVNVID